MNLPEDKKEFLVNYNIEKADTAIADARFLVENNKIYIAYNRIYYACFYILTTLSLKDNFSTSKHKQLIGWFNKNYVNTGIIEKKYGEVLKKAFEQRAKSDYGVMLNVSTEEVLQLLNEVEEFINAIKKLISKE